MATTRSLSRTGQNHRRALLRRLGARWMAIMLLLALGGCAHQAAEARPPVNARLAPGEVEPPAWAETDVLGSPSAALRSSRASGADEMATTSLGTTGERNASERRPQGRDREFLQEIWTLP
jgi:hypothetical protein